MKMTAADFDGLAGRLLAERELGTEERNRILGALAGDPRGVLRLTDLMNHFIEENSRQRNGLSKARTAHQELEAMIRTLLAPPLMPGVFVARADDGGAPCALVGLGDGRRVVSCEAGLLDELQAGDEVLLTQQLNHVHSRSGGRMTCGGTATFQRITDAGQLVLSQPGGGDVLVDPSAALAGVNLEPGDSLLWHRGSWMAIDRVSKEGGASFQFENAPDVSFDDIGGLDGVIDEIKDLFLAQLAAPELAAKYGQQGARSCLLVGRTGTGKTLLVQAMANWIRSVSPSGEALFGNERPGAHRSMWYGESEANFRRIFQAARQARRERPDRPVVLFFDEVDSVGARRGSSASTTIDDRVQTAFYAELSGFEDREQVFVFAATNRPDTLDDALLRAGRLGDRIIEIPQPGPEAAESILGKHLGKDVPCRHGDFDPAACREFLIGSVASRIYAPNGGGRLGWAKFRDGSEHPIEAADMMNGATLANLVQRAKQKACLRDIRTGVAGLTLDDLLESTAIELETLWSKLSVRNCRDLVPGLSQDLDVVSLRPAARKTSRSHRVLRAS